MSDSAKKRPFRDAKEPSFPYVLRDRTSLAVRLTRSQRCRLLSRHCERGQRLRDLGDRHGLQRDFARAGDHGVEQTFAAEHDVLHALDGDDVDGAGGAHVSDVAGVRDELLHTMACKSAIKAGMVTDKTELAALVEKVQSGEIAYCPHGRPVAVKMTKYEIEKMFKRA